MDIPKDWEAYADPRKPSGEPVKIKFPCPVLLRAVNTGGLGLPLPDYIRVKIGDKTAFDFPTMGHGSETFSIPLLVPGGMECELPREVFFECTLVIL